MSESRTPMKDGNEVYDLAGALHRILLDGGDTGGAAAVVEVTVLPGAGTPLHSEEHEDLVWHVIDGTLEFDTPDGTRTVEAGTSVFLPRGGIHAFANRGTDDAKAVMVAVPAGIEAFFREAATLLPAGVPAAPPPPEALAAFAELAAGHGITLHGAFAGLSALTGEAELSAVPGRPSSEGATR